MWRLDFGCGRISITSCNITQVLISIKEISNLKSTKPVSRVGPPRDKYILTSRQILSVKLCYQMVGRCLSRCLSVNSRHLQQIDGQLEIWDNLEVAHIAQREEGFGMNRDVEYMMHTYIYFMHKYNINIYNTYVHMYVYKYEY